MQPLERLTAHLGALRQRLPNARFVVQLDEPSLPAVLGARVPTPSGYGIPAPMGIGRLGMSTFQ